MTISAEVDLTPSRCLLIDHYDSYTHNLKDIFESILGSENVDEVKCDSKYDASVLDLTKYSIIVLSPGPGNPDNADDLGALTSSILAMYSGRADASSLPLLFGVCLGHQAIAAAFGGSIVPSCPARHGVRATVSVSASRSEGIFADIPAQFAAIRYHSLEVAEDTLPECLELLAWSWDKVDDVEVERLPIDHVIDSDSPSWLRNLRESHCICKEGSGRSRRVLMALRHRQLPMFGVQFHPESVCSEFGWQVCSNVCRMARDRKFRVCRPARSSLDLPSPRPLTRTGSIPSTGNLQLFSRSFPVGDGFDVRTFFESFICDCRDIAEDEPAPVVWLDSAKSSKHSSDGRYTFMCGGRQARGSNLCVVDDKLELLWGRDSELRPDKSQLADPGDPFVLLREYCDQLRGKVGGPLEVSSLPPLIPPCILGTLGYDGLSTVYIVSDRILAIDHSIDMVTALQVGGDDSERWFDCVGKAVKECTYLGPYSFFCCPTPVSPLELRVRDTRGCYMDKIEACQQAIAFGDSYELCLTTQIATDGDNHRVCPLCAFIRLRQRNPTNYIAFMYLPSIGYVACGSPERFCKVAEGCVEMKPIKGTRPRGQDPAEDESLVADLATSPKDFAENLMVVDLVRNDLNTVCETGSVHCPKLMKVESYQNYHQLVSTVCGRLPIEEGYHASPVAALKALFPAGSMTGAPKVRACQILDSLESGPRGIYSGAIGYVAPLNDSADFAVVIRTIVFDGSTITTGCGGAIVAGSNTKDEWDEVLVKARPQLWSLTGHQVMLTTDVGVKAVIHPKVSWDMTHLRLFETMLLKCGTIEFLDYHAQRFAASAAALWGVPRDEAEAAFRRILNAKLVGVIGPKRLRLEMNSELVEEGWRCDECPLPVATPQPLRLSETAVDHSDLRLRHKTSDRRVYPTQPDRLLYNERGEVTETPIANVGVRRKDGVIITPAGDCGLLPGCYRRWLLEAGKAVEGIITLNMLKEYAKEGREIVCFNSVRGIWRAQVQV